MKASVRLAGLKAALRSTGNMLGRGRRRPAANAATSRSLRQGLILATALVVATLAGGTVILLDRTKATALDAARLSLQRNAQIVTNTVNRNLLQVDSALASLPALLAAAPGPKGSAGGEVASHLLEASNFQTFAFRDLLLVRANGTVWAAARPRFRGKPFPFAISRLFANVQPGSVALVGPVRNPVTDEWSLYMSRQVEIAGEGALHAIAEIPLPLLVRVMAEAVDVPNLRVTLERANGDLLARLPHDELLIGRRQATPVSSVRADGVAFDVPETIIPQASIGVARPTVYGDIAVALTLDGDGALRDWMRDRRRLLIVVGLAALVVVGSAGMLLVGLRRQERLENDRSETRAVLDNAIAQMSDGFVMWDGDDRLVTCNQRYLELYRESAPFIVPGASFESIIRNGVEAGQYPQAAADPERFVRDTLAYHRGTFGSLERLLPDGRWVLITERRIAGGGIVGIRTEITALKRALDALADANHRVQAAMAEVRHQNDVLTERDTALRMQNVLFDAALNNMAHGLLMTDREGRLIVSNRQLLQLFGLGEDALQPGMTSDTVFERLEAGGTADAAMIRLVRGQLDDLSRDGRSGTFVAAGEGGLALSVSQQPLLGGGWIATFVDVTEQQKAEGQVRFLAHHDALTRLPNRLLFRNRIDEILRSIGADRRRLAILYLDLDDFKNVNDTLGHSIGDALLEVVGRRLSNCLREADTVARLGGDEFAVACRSDDMPNAAFALGRRIIEALNQPYLVSGHTVTTGVSIGIAVADQSEGMTDADTLLKNADMALYEAKAEGRGRFRLFEREMESKLLARLELEEQLKTALDRGEFHLAYQPLLALDGLEVSGFEALVRWRHPERGPVSPGEFIPVAEQTGLIAPLGEWVIRQACRDAAAWPASVRVAVNLSPVQLRSDDIVRIVAEALRDSGLPPPRLELEITESALLTDNDRTMRTLHRLRDLGLKIVLDDFGTGFSSLSHLRMFPFHKIKIDQSFVREMPVRTDCVAIVGSLVDMARRLGIRTTAEGVETAEQLDLVRSAGCGEVQGYLFGRPDTTEAAALRLRAGSPADGAAAVEAA